MRRLPLIVIFLSLVVIACFTAMGCAEKKAPPQDTVSAAPLEIYLPPVDSDSVETLIAATPMPKAAEELFDDFIFNFAANKRLQLDRIAFPLPEYMEGEVVNTYSRKEWQMEHFFMRQDYYTLIFNDARQMEVVKDTSVNRVVIEKIYLRENTIKQYLFRRLNGEWKMTAIHQQDMEESDNGSFLRFYEKFAIDSLFQQQHLGNPVLYSGPDPDDDFGTMTGEIIPDTWSAFAPELPSGMIYNIRYGTEARDSKMRIFVLRGIANGMEMWLTFKHVGEEWLLTKLNT